jgi:hypothetical protein
MSVGRQNRIPLPRGCVAQEQAAVSIRAAGGFAVHFEKI